MRPGVAHPSRRSSFGGTAPGELDRRLPHSAAQWLDAGPVAERLRELLDEIDRGDYDGDRETVTELLGHLEFCRRHDLFMVVA
ncbi:hypothetical protein AB0H83_06230 [Dactylosporangium sp. NPDC050688]|uniref:hypothetical protein n=1 Tax=Dactylosporangium sp. NPDC050688 TaxID=3157217 RepID=UPI0033F8C87B